jgi:hypothetical protein
MSLRPQVAYLVPEETARVAHAAFPTGKNIYMQMRDQLGSIFDDQQFASLFILDRTGGCSVELQRCSSLRLASHLFWSSRCQMSKQ